ncbi:MAG: histidine--tRNA ligase [Patescibacteria group bacterium]|jgi:histidyl-tRNA synthetase
MATDKKKVPSKQQPAKPRGAGSLPSSKHGALIGKAAGGGDAKPVKVEKKEPARLLRGFRDVMPEEAPFWRYIYEVTEYFADIYDYTRIQTPILEQKHLFERTLGDESDVVSKEMFEFRDRSGEHVALKPEMTAPVVRAYVEHGMFTRPQPVRLWYWEPLFRYDRPQAGRYRQHTQLGFESIGDDHPVIDAQHILIAKQLFESVGITPYIQVNSLGDAQCRPQYIKALQEYYRSRKTHLSEEAKERLKTNPLRLLDSKDPELQELASMAPQMVDHLCEPCKEHFMSVVGYLDHMEVPYTLNGKLVRGFDYYTRTVFEIWPAEDETGAQSALGGGGRYNKLVSDLGSHEERSAIGFACGVERIIRKMREQNLAPPSRTKPLYLAQLGDEARKKSIILLERLRQEGIPTYEHLSKDGLKSQLENANRLGVQYALIIGQKEIVDGTVLIRDMENGIQETVDFEKVPHEIRKRLQARGALQEVHMPNKPEHHEPPPTVEGEESQVSTLDQVS